MAMITLGIGMSHTPRLATKPEDWHHFGSFAASMGGLVDVDGTTITLAEVEAKYGDRYAQQATLAAWRKSSEIAQAALDRLAESVQDAQLDVLVVVGDDQHELLTPGNYPALLVFYGDAFKMVDGRARSARRGNRPLPAKMGQQLLIGSYMDANHLYPNHPQLARAIIESAVAHGLTPAVSEENPADPAFGYGHAFGVVIAKILQQQRIPVIPIVVNTYFPPNQPTSDICLQVGKAIHDAVTAFPEKLTVGVLASGGMSHFVVDEAWDSRVLALLREGDLEGLRQIPASQLQSGNSELLNWMVAAAACRHLSVQWDRYTPVYSTPYREGVGLAFMEWA